MFVIIVIIIIIISVTIIIITMSGLALLTARQRRLAPLWVEDTGTRPEQRSRDTEDTSPSLMPVTTDWRCGLRL